MRFSEQGVFENLFSNLQALTNLRKVKINCARVIFTYKEMFLLFASIVQLTKLKELKLDFDT